MFDINQLSNATAQLTGESLEGARQRLGAMERYDHLIPAASASQALLESALLSALGAVEGQNRPFGVREARPAGEGLALRLERVEDVQALFPLLPYRSKKGPWRGARELTVELGGAGLKFGLGRPTAPRSWGKPSPQVWVGGPHGEDLAALLAVHEQNLTAAGHTAQWDPTVSQPRPTRREPVERSLMQRLDASYALGSALLRRPRLWDSLASYAGLHVETQMADHGLDWVVEREVLGGQFDDERLIEVLTDHIVGFGLRVLDHACSPQECTVQVAPRPGRSGMRGVLTVHSRRVPTGSQTHVSAPRPLTAIGERLNISRPSRAASTPEPATARRNGTVLQLFCSPDASRHSYDDLIWTAEQIAAVWAAQGLATALLHVETEERLAWVDRGKPPWATQQVPKTVAGWHRLRVTPPPGELWYLNLRRKSEAIAAAVADARGTFDRVILLGWTEWASEQSALGHLADARVLVHTAAPYERTIPLAANGEQETKTLMLTPAESAATWHREELGRWFPTPPMAGMLLLDPDYTQAPMPDAFDLAVEEQLARYEVHILGRFPKNERICREAGASLHAPTVLDPQTDQPSHAQMTTAATEFARQLWPGRPATTTSQAETRSLEAVAARDA
ncbi:hypothetical protein [Streptomyces sp. NPDC093589]|uniref:hypothetical protein n=1 Tax=Streptomyces sp. NPDC093589 TaxID=3366043 RepID=UPI0037FF597C